MRTLVPLLLAGLVLGPVAATFADAMPVCPPQPTHTYVGPVGAVVLSSTALGLNTKGGQVTVTDTNLAGCDANLFNNPDFDGDYDLGVGGGFFGWGPWANEPVCQYGLHVHGPDVLVYDIVWNNWVQFEIGANDMDGPVVSIDTITSETTCETDGIIAPTLDLDDCLAGVYMATGKTCGGGGDGGYWVILDVVVEVSPDNVSGSNPPVAGLITAGWFGAPYTAYPGVGYVAVQQV